MADDSSDAGGRGDSGGVQRRDPVRGWKVCGPRRCRVWLAAISSTNDVQRNIRDEVEQDDAYLVNRYLCVEKPPKQQAIVDDGTPQKDVT